MAKQKGILPFSRTAFPLLRNKKTGRIGKAIKLFSFYSNQDKPLWVCDVMYVDDNSVVYTQKGEDWELVGEVALREAAWINTGNI